MESSGYKGKTKEELLYLCGESSIVTPLWLRWARHVDSIGWTWYKYSILLGQPLGSRPFAILSQRDEDNIKMGV